MYAILALGLYITYSILDFPDLSVDGSMPLGAIVTALLILRGIDPWLCLCLSFLAGALCILFALFYFVYVPWRIWPGQTLGKHIAGYRIEKTDGTAVDLLTLLKRQVIGGFLLEGAAFVASNYIRQLVTLSLSYYVDYYWQIAGMILTALSLILVMKTDSHRTLHDYLAKTKVACVEKSS